MAGNMRLNISHYRAALVASGIALLSACGQSPDVNVSNSGGESVLARAACGAGSLVEPGVQGQVPIEDRASGRSMQGYRCNLELVGRFQGEGASWVNPSSGNCFYMGTAFGGLLSKQLPGVQVIDASDPGNLRLATSLDSPAMLIGPWESLKVNDRRGLLGGVAVGPIQAAAFFDVYDIAGNCAQPRLLNSLTGNLTLPANFMGHEGEWAPDGKTYWATGAFGGAITAINVDDPAQPTIAYVASTVLTNHGFQLSDDGNRLYLSMALPAGLVILDVSEVQSRQPFPIVRQVAQLFWNVAGVSQHTIPVRYGDRPYLITVDEFGSESIKLIDISDETKPSIASEFRLEINRPENAALRRADTGGNGLFGYESHYCTVDRKLNPTALACGYLQSGIRVFDIRNFRRPREIAYFNPPAQTNRNAQLPGSEHAAGLSITSFALPISDIGTSGVAVPYLLDPPLAPKADLSSDWCSSPPRFVPPDQLWVTCQDNGAMVLRFTNGAYPLAS